MSYTLEFAGKTSYCNTDDLVIIAESLEALDMGIVARKPVFGVSDKANVKPVSSATATS